MSENKSESTESRMHGENDTQPILAQQVSLVGPNTVRKTNL